YRGYWLFGFLVADLGEFEFDLISDEVDAADSVIGSAARLAASRFADQMRKARLARSQVREASLRISKSPEVIARSTGGVTRNGHMIRFSARAVMDDNKLYLRELQVFVAPHNERVELQSKAGT